MSLGTGKPWELYIWIVLSSSDEKSSESPSQPFAVCDAFVILVHIVISPGSDLCRYKHYNEQELGCVWLAARELTDCWGDASLYEEKEYSFKSQKLVLIERGITSSCRACQGQISFFWNWCLDWQTTRPLFEIFFLLHFSGVRSAAGCEPRSKLLWSTGCLEIFCISLSFSPSPSVMVSAGLTLPSCGWWEMFKRSDGSLTSASSRAGVTRSYIRNYINTSLLLKTTPWWLCSVFSTFKGKHKCLI